MWLGSMVGRMGTSLFLQVCGRVRRERAYWMQFSPYGTINCPAVPDSTAKFSSIFPKMMVPLVAAG
jgi:hypothetical protein